MILLVLIFADATLGLVSRPFSPLPQFPNAMYLVAITHAAVWIDPPQYQGHPQLYILFFILFGLCLTFTSVIAFFSGISILTDTFYNPSTSRIELLHPGDWVPTAVVHASFLLVSAVYCAVRAAVHPKATGVKAVPFRFQRALDVVRFITLAVVLVLIGCSLTAPSLWQVTDGPHALLIASAVFPPDHRGAAVRWVHLAVFFVAIVYSAIQLFYEISMVNHLDDDWLVLQSYNARFDGTGIQTGTTYRLLTTDRGHAERFALESWRVHLLNAILLGCSASLAVVTLTASMEKTCFKHCKL